MPGLDWGQHLVDSLLEFGPCGHGMSGPIPVSFSEIQAWAFMTKTEIPGYEALQLRQLSRDYCMEYHAASKPNRPQPSMPGEAVNRDHVARGFAALIKQHKAKQNG